MKERPPTPGTLLLNAVSGWIGGRPPATLPKDADLPAFLGLVKTHRLEPLMERCLTGSDGDSRPGPTDMFGRARRRCLVQTLCHEAAAAAISDALGSQSIDCIGLRGPFADLELYGNEGRRSFTDLDLLVPARFKKQSLRVLQTLGYDFPPGSLPEWFYSRHHLHWPLVNLESRIACDVHWAIDHPYSLLAVDYDAVFRSSVLVPTANRSWRRPEPGHAVLIQAAHLAKESAVSGACPDQYGDLAERVLASGQLLKWIDLALMINHYSSDINWRTLSGTAVEWKMIEQLSAALRGCAALFDGSVPGEAMEIAVASKGKNRRLRRINADRPGNPPLPHPRVGALGQRGGFRAIRLADAIRFFWPPESYFGASRGILLLANRITHSVLAIPKLSLALLDGSVCMLIVAARSRR